jgi:hypothetical protein
MKISLKEHGGQAAGILLGRPARVLDTDTLPPPAVEELARLVDAAKAAPPATEASPRRGGPGHGGDVMSCTITVQDSGDQTVLKQSETAMSPAFRNLRDWLEQHMK